MERRVTDEMMTKRFYILNSIVTVVLIGAVFISIMEFGSQTWTNRQMAGLILPGSKDEPGWNKAQAIGLMGACKEQNYDLLLRENVNAKDSEKVVNELAHKGVELIFLTNRTPEDKIHEFEKKYPRIRFYAIESTFAQSNMSRYSIDYISLRYVSGVLAGLRTKTNRIGYAAPTATAPVLQGINAFTLGVQRVNPNAQVILTWTGSLNNPANEQQAIRNLKAERVDVMTYFHNGRTVPKAAQQAGIDYIAFHEAYPEDDHCIASIETDWKTAYMDILRMYRRQTYNTYLENKGVAKLKTIMSRLSLRERAIYETTMWQMKRNRQVFMGEIYDINGIKRCNAGEIISNEYLQTRMDWLVRGVTVIS